MDFSELMKIASQNKSSAHKQQQRQKVTNSKTNHASGEKVSHEAVQAFLAKKEEEKKRQKAEEEAARRARIKARLEAESKAKAAGTRQTSDTKHKDSQVHASVTSSGTSRSTTGGQKHASKNSHTDRLAKKQPEKTENFTKAKERHEKSFPKPKQENSAEVSKKDKGQVLSKPEKQASSKVTGKGRKPPPVSFKDLLRIAEQKTKEPISNTEPQKHKRSPFEANNQSKHKEKSKNGAVPVTLKGASGSRAKTNNIQETPGKKRRSDQSGTGKAGQSEMGSKLPQSSKRPKNSHPGPSPPKAGKRDISTAVQGNVNHKQPSTRVMHERGSSIEAQFGSSLIKTKTLSATNSIKVKHSQGSKMSACPQVSRDKPSIERNPIRRDACAARGSGIEAQFGSGKVPRAAQGYYDRTSHKRKLDYEDDELDEYDDELDDFIDDGGEEVDVSRHIKEIFGYDKSRYRDSEDDVRNMESSFSQIEKEEIKSQRIARLEDEVEFLKEQAMLKKERDKLRKSLKRK